MKKWQIILLYILSIISAIISRIGNIRYLENISFILLAVSFIYTGYLLMFNKRFDLLSYVFLSKEQLKNISKEEIEIYNKKVKLEAVVYFILAIIFIIFGFAK